MRVIGVVGQPSSGKDTVGNYIATKGYKALSSGDAIREDMRKENLPLDRTSMHNFTVGMRKKIGMHYPLNKVVDSIREDTVISGMRNTAEVNFLQKAFDSNFTLIAVETAIEKRYEWAKARGRIGDDISFERFKQEEEFEKSKNDGTYEVDKVVEMANYKIDNSTTEEDLYKKVDEILEKII